MIVDTMTKPINFVKIVWECEGGIFDMEIRYDLVNSRGNFEEEGVVDKFEEAVEGELVKIY